MTAQLLEGVSHDDYCRDELPGSPHFSRSVALTLLQRAPLHAWHAHPLLGGKREEDDTEATDNGSLLHGLILGTGPAVSVIEADSYRTKAAQEARDAARAVGAIPVLARSWEATEAAAQALRAKLLALGVPLETCAREVTVLWEDTDGGLASPVACKARLDLFSRPAARVWDLKSTAKLSPGAFLRGMVPYGLDIQIYAYESAAAAACPELAGRVRLEFLLLESKPPYSVAVQPVAESMRTNGRTRWGSAARIWRRCLETNTFPDYGVLPPAEAPAWALQESLLASLGAGEDPDWMKGE